LLPEWAKLNLPSFKFDAGAAAVDDTSAKPTPTGPVGGAVDDQQETSKGNTAAAADHGSQKPRKSNQINDGSKPSGSFQQDCLAIGCKKTYDSTSLRCPCGEPNPMASLLSSSEAAVAAGHGSGITKSSIATPISSSAPAAADDISMPMAMGTDTVNNTRITTNPLEKENTNSNQLQEEKKEEEVAVPAATNSRKRKLPASKNRVEEVESEGIHTKKSPPRIRSATARARVRL